MSRDFGALIGSRICHDLVSPLGAIANGLELLSMAPGGTSPEMELIAQSVAEANGRILLFRVAFGAPSTQEVGAHDIAGILAPLRSSRRLQIDWQVEGAVPRDELRLACLGLLTLESALPRGGAITVRRGDPAWELTARAPRISDEPELWDSLLHPDTAPEPRPGRVHVPLAGLAARDLGRIPVVEREEDTVILTL